MWDAYTQFSKPISTKQPGLLMKTQLKQHLGYHPLASRGIYEGNFNLGA
jgi:hypothetical protein